MQVVVNLFYKNIYKNNVKSFDKHTFEGSHTGTEFWSWDGMTTGYEGVMTHNYAVFYAIAAHKGWVKPLKPEW